MDPVERAKSTMGSVERTISNLPGIRGYREKEMRREADKQVRDLLANELATRRNRITSLQHNLLSGGGLLWMDDMERVVGRLQLLIDRVRTASYGYAPFFNLEEIKEPELDRLIEYDRSLFDELPRLDQAVDGLDKAIGSNENVQETLQTVAGILTELNDRFTRREEALREVIA